MSIIPAAEPPEGALPAGGGYWFTPLPVYLLEAVFDPASPVNAPAAMLWAHIHRNYAWRRRVFPSYAKLAEETGQSESAVKRQLTALKAAGALTWGATYGVKGRSSNEYALAPMKPFDFDRAVEVKSDPHPPVQVRNDLGVEVKNEPYPQVKNDLGVKNTVELENTSSSRMPKPRRAPAPVKAEEEGRCATPEQQQARLFLMRLPAPWTLGPADAAKVAPTLAAAVTRLGLDYDDHLAGQIAFNDFGVNNFASVIETKRIPNLRPAAAKPGALPPACPACLAANPAAQLNKRFRTHSGLPAGRPCSACHPDHAAPTAA
ncbi:helix-turn-helix domain-containing protein [Kitasatospora mediocidica]|uniref:helix-turn-helix domain-containing protein n=1 Tax=Kitasatospora mediocidica TaxID=58352 RepID=UPI000567AAD4|nr:helix-turn-helix domain-containing protein [Kitasatospora mediocidica]